MPHSAHVIQCLHAAVYDLTGWALPDSGLHQLASHLPDRVWQAIGLSSQALSRDVRQWCEGQAGLVKTVIHQLQPCG